MQQAIIENDINAVVELLNTHRQQCLTMRDAHGNTLLHFAASEGSCDAVWHIINAGLNVNTANCYSETPLHLAVKNMQSASVAHLVSARADVNALNSSTGQYPLGTAVYNNDVTTVETLLDTDANVNAFDTNDRTALNYAIDNNNVDLIRLLVMNNADTQLRNTRHETALDYAYNKDACNDVIQMLNDISGWMVDAPTQTATPMTTQHMVLAPTTPMTVPAMTLIDITARDRQELTPLMMFALARNMISLKNVLDAHDDNRIIVSASDAYGNTAMHLAALDNDGCANLKKLNYVYKYTKHAQIPTQAFVVERKNILRELELNCADVNAKNAHGNTPLHMAIVSGGSYTLVQELIKLRADVDVKNNDGCVPLHFAAAFSTTKVFNMLLKQSLNQDTFACDNAGYHITDWAKYFKNTEVLSHICNSVVQRV